MSDHLEERLAGIRAKDNVLLCLPGEGEVNGGWGDVESLEVTVDGITVDVAAMCAQTLTRRHLCQDVVLVCRDARSEVLRVMCFDGVSGVRDSHAMALALADGLSRLDGEGRLPEFFDTVMQVAKGLNGEDNTSCTMVAVDLERVDGDESRLLMDFFTVGDAPFFVFEGGKRCVLRNRERSVFYDSVLGALNEKLGALSDDLLVRRLGGCGLNDWGELFGSGSYERGLFFELLAWEIVGRMNLGESFSLLVGELRQSLNIPEQVLNFGENGEIGVECDGDANSCEKEVDGFSLHASYESRSIGMGDTLVLGSDAVLDMSFLNWLKVLDHVDSAVDLVKVFRDWQRFLCFRGYDCSDFVKGLGGESSLDDTSCVAVRVK